MKTFNLNSHLLATAISATLLVGCNGNDHDNSSATKTPTRTILVYMVGSDLESGGGAATADINEMLKVGSTDNLNIILTTGGANKDGWKTVKRYLIPQGTKTIASIKELIALADLGDKNMGSAATLQDFLDWGIKNYSADNYSLVFWDHGGGAVGGDGTVGFDENHGSDGLSLPEIKQAISSTTTLNKKRFDFIGFDTCLMATLETANMLVPYADYMVASEEVEPGSGWDYTAWLTSIKNTPSISTLDISKKIIDSYYASFATNLDEQKNVTLSAIQLNKVSILTTELDKLAKKISNNLNSAPDSVRMEVGQGRERSESYGKQNGDDAGMIDLVDFVSKLTAAYSTEANNVKIALSDVIAYSKHGSSRPQAKGLSIYLPSSTTIRSGVTSDIQKYKDIGFLASWTTFVDSYASKADADNTAPALSNEQQTGDTLSVNINSNDTNAVSVYITHDNGDGTQLVLSREDADTVAGGKATYTFNNSILLVNGQYVYTELVESDVDNGLFTLGAPVMVNGKQATLVILATVKDGDVSFDVIGQIPESTNGAVSRLIALQTGDVVDPLFLNYNPANDATELVTQSGNSFTVTATGVNATIGALPADSYNAYFAVEDYSGNLQYSSAFSLVVPTN